MRIGYFADGIWGHNTFNKLLNDSTLEIAFVCPRYDYQDPILTRMAKQNNIDVLLLSNVNSLESLAKIREYSCDLLISMSFNQIFKKDIVDMAPLKLINCHAGKLPFYRGRNILNWALINDEKEFGITVHYVDEGIDTGDIILQRTFPITDADDYSSLLTVAHIECAEVLFDAVKNIQAGTYARIVQADIHPFGFYCGMRKQGDEVIDWNQSSRVLYNFIRAITSPGPCAQTKIKDNIIKIIKSELISSCPSYIGIPGQVIGKDAGALLVKTKDTVIKVTNYRSEINLRVGDRFE